MGRSKYVYNCIDTVEVCYKSNNYLSSIVLQLLKNNGLTTYDIYADMEGQNLTHFTI